MLEDFSEYNIEEVFNKLVDLIDKQKYKEPLERFFFVNITIDVEHFRDYAQKVIVFIDWRA